MGPASRIATALAVAVATTTATAASMTATTSARAAPTSPTVQLNPATGAPGDIVTASGTGFADGTLELHLDQLGTALAEPTPSTDGGFTQRFVIPRTEPGPHTVIACLDRRDTRCAQRATASIRVTEHVPPTAPPATTLPPTTVTSVAPPTTGVLTPTSTGPDAVAVTFPITGTTLPEAPTVAAIAVSSGEEVGIGALSGDATEWTPEVADAVATAAAATDAAGGAPAAGAPGNVVSNEGCAVQCIRAGLAYAVGTGANLRVTTAVPATIDITVFGGGEPVSSAPGSLQFAHTWPDLAPGTVYTAMARATDAAGNVAIAAGTFETRQRHVHIEIADFAGQTQLPFDQFSASAMVNGALVASWDAASMTNPAVLWAPPDPVPAVLDVLVVGQMTDDEASTSCQIDVPASAGTGGGPIGPGVSNCWYITGNAATTLALDVYPPTAEYWSGHAITWPIFTPCTPPAFCDETAPFPFTARLDITVTYH
ncbi:MAG: hypothetical protein ACK5OX_06825 [Desertimonas sp.]